MKCRTHTAPSKKHVYTFSGFLRCSDCVKSMTRNVVRRKTKYLLHKSDSGLYQSRFYIKNTIYGIDNNIDLLIKLFYM